MTKNYLVTYQECYWDAERNPEIRQGEVMLDGVDDMTDGQIVLELQNSLIGGYIKSVIVLNFWELDLV